MRRFCRCSLVLLLLLTLSLSGQALTLPELWAEVPERLLLTVEGPDGPVSVDAPIIVPEGGALPVLRAGPRHLDARTVYEAYDSAPTDESYGWYEQYLNDETAPLFVYPRDLESERYVSDKYGGNANAERLYSLTGQPDNNDLPREAPEALLRRILSLAGAEDADVRLSGQMAVSRPYQAKIIKTKDDEAPILVTADLDNPIPYPERGYWVAGFSQYLNGVQVFSEGYQAEAPTKYGAAPSSPYGPTLQVEMVSEEDYYVMASLLEVRGELEAAPDLAPFRKVQDTLEAHIASGDLLDVRELELGYMLFWEVPPSELEENEYHSGMGRYVLAPVWRVTGYAVKDRGSFKFYRKGADPSKPDEVDYGYASTLFGAYQVRIDARTGELLTSEVLDQAY